MKYSVNINQVAAAQLGDLDLIDCAVIEWLMAICNSKSSAIERNRIRGMTWVKYSYLSADMPLLKLNSRESVRKRLVHLKECGYIRMVLIGQRVYVDVLEKCELLLVENLWKFEARNEKPSTVVDGIVRPSTQSDSYYINNISKESKGSTEALKPQGESPGYQRYLEKKALLTGVKAV